MEHDVLVANPPTAGELFTALENMDDRTIRYLLKQASGLSYVDTTKPLCLSTILRMAVANWLTGVCGVDVMGAQGVLEAMDEGLSRFSRSYVTSATVPGATRPIGSLAIMDGRFALMPLHGNDIGMYDIQEDRLLTELAEHAMTSVACDLAVMLLRLGRRVKQLRTLKEVGDAKHPVQSEEAAGPGADG
jgi:hypothetical protein